ncbi:endonuclease/exonuclease/phosphatase family protein [Mycolicibacterium sp. 120266]|uniref:endonuclease/exonuclease/phosphatase family protein n=1 Tax=Mycolicibacterium sp. 120266 TaxID=3090601 RepID=UPI00299D582A|nr:endonuclease/exonuclease/phosphatase family protein [Mycolicibacterium sp. 120266]MDX1874525.1 endonuclease/exonuclease/phosphatase family protein [Mycolicibacterium sp. 120266]
MTTRIAALNIRHGGSKCAGALATRLLGYDADIVVVTEFRADGTGVRLKLHLAAAGYTTSHPDTDPKHNSTLIASRHGVTRARAFADDVEARHLWCAETAGVVLCAVYLPQKVAELRYLQAVVRDARASGIDVLVGDFNTGNNDLDKEPQGAGFIGSEMPGRLIGSGYLDVWRSRHPATREYLWFSRPGDDGFRLDHLYASPELAHRVSLCEFDHAPRLAGETDHSALVTELG